MTLKLSIGGCVFDDVNGDGIVLAKDASGNFTGGEEPGISGVIVRVVDASGKPVSFLNSAGESVSYTVTDSRGFYKIFGLAEGSGYKVQFDYAGLSNARDLSLSPANVVDPGLVGQGGSEGKDSDAVRTLSPSVVETDVVIAGATASNKVNLGLIKEDEPTDPGTAKIGNQVWLDANENGRRDNGEVGVQGVQVTLAGAGADGQFGTGDDITKTTTTNSKGFYHFKNLNAGDYKVTFEQPTGFDFTRANAVGEGRDSDADVNTGMTDVISLAEGERNHKVDAGVIKKEPEKASLGDRVFLDANKNGLQDDGEQGVEGVTVTLTGGGADGVIGTGDDTTETLTTNANGNYQFTDLNPGEEYKVTFSDIPDGFEFTQANAGNDTLDSDADPSNGMTQVVTLDPGENNPTLDAGIVEKEPERASLGDRVFLDTNENGLQDDGEQGVQDVTVTLTGGGADGVIGTGDDTTETTTTNANGNYQFTDLNPGEEYKVTFSDIPDGFEFTQANAGDDARDSDADPSNGMTQVVTLDPGENNPTLDAGIVEKEPEKASLGDRVFLDANKNGLQDDGEQGVEGVTVTLTGGGADGVIGTGDDTTETLTTNANGNYQFTDLNPGEEYKVTFSDIPDGFEFTQANAGNDDSADSDANPANGMTQVVTLAPGENNPTLDAGIVEAAPGIDIEKFVNGIDVTDLNDLPEITAGSDVTFTYEVTNTGNVAFSQAQVSVVDDNGTAGNSSDDFIPTLVASSDVGGDGILSAGETWTYTSQTLSAESLNTVIAAQDLQFDLTGNSSKTGSRGNVRTFSAGGVSVDARAFYYNYSNQIEAAYLGAYDTGLGVTNRLESGSFSDYKLDSIQNPEYILFEFDQDVVFDRVFLDGIETSYSTYQSNIFMAIADRNGQSLDAGDILDSSLFNTVDSEFLGNNGRVSSRWSDLNANEVVGDTLLLRTGSNTNLYTLKTLDVTVPGETTLGQYRNVVTVTADGVSDSDESGYVNPFEAGLGDRVWFDDNNNGLQDNGEQGVQGVTVTLTGGGADGVIGTGDDTTETTTTNAGGNYQFTELNPGEEYKVTFSNLPDGFEFTQSNAGDDTRDSDVNPSNGMTQIVTLAPGEFNPTLDAGIVERGTGLARLGDRVWLDANENGLQDGNEQGVEGVTVTLTGGGADGVIGTGDDTTETTTTNAGGNYQFTELNPGEEYKVTFSNLPEGFVFTQANVGDDTLDSDANPLNGMTQTVTLAPGENNPTLDAGIFEQEICAKLTSGLVGYDASTTLPESYAYSYAIELDRPSSTDQTFTVTLNNGTAQYGAGSLYTSYTEGGAYDYRAPDGNIYTDFNVVPNNPDAPWQGNTPATATDSNRDFQFGRPIDGDFITSNTMQFTVPAGQTRSNAFYVSATLETVYYDPSRGFNGSREGNETFFIDVTPQNSEVEFKNPRTTVTIYDGSSYLLITPIAFDLNGDGIQTLSIDAGVEFDMLNTGSAVNTGWLSGNDGFLAVDNDDDGMIASRDELFGGGLGDGFAKLSSYDSNGDGFVNALDDRFGELKLWQDANENGITDSGELMSLASAGITDLNTSYTDVFSTDAAGNVHGEHSSASLNGNRIDMVDVYFQVAV